VHSDAYDWKAGLSADLVHDAHSQFDAGTRTITAKHHRITDALDLLSPVLGEQITHRCTELSGEVRSVLVAMDFRQGCESRQICE
jgi:hypothetical protein